MSCPRTCTKLGWTLAILLAALLACWLPATAAGDAPNPSSNYPLGALPQTCESAPNGAGCVDAALADLNLARAANGLPAYQVPADFDTLPGDAQALILTNLDRIAYGLTPVTGITSAFDQDSQQGVADDDDPSSTGSGVMSWGSNWAGGYPNLTAAYEGWLWDDGPGSGNLDCTAIDTSGCWGHRHNVLANYAGGGALAMGAAAGTDRVGVSGFAMIIGDLSSAQTPRYTYTWAEALADGAGAGLTGSSSGSGSTAGTSSSTATSTPSTPAPASGGTGTGTITVTAIPVGGSSSTNSVVSSITYLLAMGLTGRTVKVTGLPGSADGRVVSLRAVYTRGSHKLATRQITARIRNGVATFTLPTVTGATKVALTATLPSFTASTTTLSFSAVTRILKL